MAWLTAKQDLRILLSDGPTDRFCFRKQVFGELNGSNTRFKTFDFRRVTNFLQTPGVFLNGNLLATSAVSADNPYNGEFILQTPPIDGDLLEANYYIQWFLDSELDDFLQQAALWTLGTFDVTQVSNGLIPACKKYAAAEAYLKMAMKWRDYLSSGFKVEDAPNPDAAAKTNEFLEMSKTFRKEALDARTEFYQTRQGQALQPLFGNVIGSVRSMP
jgi:hypothetical protein